MSKAVAGILATAGTIALVATGVGAAAGLALFGTTAGISVAGASLGTLLLASSALTAAGSLVGSLSMPRIKPEQTETAIKNPIPPRVSGYGIQRLYMAYALYTTGQKGVAYDVGVFHDGRIDDILQHYLGDTKITPNANGWVPEGAEGEWGRADRVRVGTTLGASPNTAFSVVADALPDRWSNQHRGDGVVTGYVMWRPVQATNFQRVYPNGGPNASPLNLVMRLQPVFDWRDPSQQVGNPATWKWSENAVLHLAHYELVRAGRDWDTHFAPTLAYWTAAANDADSPMPLRSGATEPRYRGCVVHKHTDAHKDVRANLLACFDGWMAPRADGALVVYSGRYQAPTVEIGPDETLSYSLQDGVDEEAALNQIAVTYISAEHDYAAVDTDSWEDADDIAARGKVLGDGLEVQTPSFSQNRRLAKRQMARVMAPKRGQVSTNARGRIVRGQRYIRLRLVDAGTTFLDAPVEITKLTRNLATGGVTFEWVLADPNIDAWNPATEEGRPAPVGNPQAQEPVDAPTVTSAVPDFTAVSDDGTGVRVTILAEGPDRSDLVWFARWRLAGSPTWNESTYPDVDEGAEVELQTGFVPATATVEVAVAYQVGDGRVSPYSTAVTVDARTDATPPDVAEAPVLTSWDDAIVVSVPRIARASSYTWRFFDTDGTTLLATITTSGALVTYTASRAAADGVRRAYKVDVAGANGAGLGARSPMLAITHPAPAAVVNPAIAGGATTATATCNALSGAAGYVVFYAATAGFDPTTTGGVVTSGAPSIPIYGLAAGTYYGRVAAYDRWTANPALLNLSAEIPFTITTGGGSTPSGGGTGGGGYKGGGYGPGQVAIP